MDAKSDTYELNRCNVEYYNNDKEDDDDWETAIIPDLRERKLLEERKKVEEADNILAEELFSGLKKSDCNQDGNQDGNQDDKSVILKKPNNKKEKLMWKEKLIENQKEKSEKIKKRKLEKTRLIDIYGEAELDEYDELYGSIQDKY